LATNYSSTNKPRTDFEKLAIYNTGMTDKGQQIFLNANPVQKDFVDVVEHCPVNPEEKESWMFIGCFHNGKIIITQIELGSQFEDLDSIEEYIADTAYRAVVYSVYQAAYKQLSKSEKDSIKIAIDSVYSKVNDYAKGNVEGSILENDGDEYQTKFAVIGTWDTDVSNELKYYFSRYFDIEKTKELTDLTDLQSGLYSIAQDCWDDSMEDYNTTLEDCEDADSIPDYAEYLDYVAHLYTINTDSKSSS
jgi:hypothetical protein